MLGARKETILFGRKEFGDDELLPLVFGYIEIEMSVPIIQPFGNKA